MDIIKANGPELEDFANKFLKIYLQNGFGRMSKTELDIMVFHLLASTSFSSCSNYELSRILKISETKNKDLIETALHYIHQNYTSNISLALVAGQVHLNATYFSTLFKKETGVSFTHYINDMRINGAKHLLSSTNGSILEVAIATGFEDQSYFCKVFKRATGITPGQYRQ